MEAKPKKVVMAGAAWTVPTIILFSRSKWIATGMLNPHVFPDKTPNEKAEMLGQVWDIADKMEPKKKK